MEDPKRMMPGSISGQFVEVGRATRLPRLGVHNEVQETLADVKPHRSDKKSLGQILCLQQVRQAVNGGSQEAGILGSPLPGGGLELKPSCPSSGTLPWVTRLPLGHARGWGRGADVHPSPLLQIICGVRMGVCVCGGGLGRRGLITMASASSRFRDMLSDRKGCPCHQGQGCGKEAHPSLSLGTSCRLGPPHPSPQQAPPRPGTPPPLELSQAG